VLTRASVCWVVLPGTDTFRSWLPSVWTSAPELPVPLTRAKMIEMASVISALDGVPPVGVVALMVTWVPLDRSSPRPTLKSLCHWPGLAMFPPRTPRSMITISANSAASARPGCGTVFVGAATSPPVLNRSFAHASGSSENVVLVGLGQLVIMRIRVIPVT
jgi:hypothetical protein